MKAIIQAIQNKIQTVTGVKYVDEDWGQLDYFSPNFPVKFPCVLIDVANATYNNIGQDKRAKPINRQMADATISLTIANLKLTNSSGIAPQFRCELLSNLYFCVRTHNLEAIKAKLKRVVNCFQICIFV